jgi:hypothetical protein
VTVDPTSPDQPLRQTPRRLAVAAVIVALESLTLVAVGLSVLVSSSGARAALDITTTVFFAAYAVGLIVCARGLWLGRRWSRAPVVFTQLIQLGVAWSFASGSTLFVTAILAVAAGTILALVLSPASTRVFRRGLPT